MLCRDLGNPNAPAIVMLPGSFCPGETMEYLYSRLQDEYRLLIFTYNGHHAGSKDFSTRQQEAAEMVRQLQSIGIERIAMVYGQSMGAEMGAELIVQLAACGIPCGCAFFDGAPMIRLSKLYKAFMCVKFTTMVRLIRSGNIDKMLNMGIVRRMTNGDTECLRDTLKGMQPAVECLTKTSIRNVNECCYTFDYPRLDAAAHARWFFFYARQEKACKTCLRHVQKAYPEAEYRIVDGYGHLSYSLRHPDAYAEMLRTWLQKHNP